MFQLVLFLPITPLKDIIQLKSSFFDTKCYVNNCITTLNVYLVELYVQKLVNLSYFIKVFE